MRATVIKNIKICHHWLVFILTLSFISSLNALNQSADSFGFQSFTFSVNENTVGYVGNVSTWPNMTLELDASGQTFLNISSTEEGTAAILTLIKPLDREVQEYYNFTIFTTIGSNVRSFKNFTIKVLDVNDNAPVFVTNDSSFSLECFKTGSVITQVRATDQDTGLNGQIQYYIDEKYKFAIDDRSGIITVKQFLNSSIVYKVIITAKDAGSPSLQANKTIEIRALSNKKNTLKQWSTKGTHISGIDCSDKSLYRSLNITKETKNKVITADRRNFSIKVNRLISEPPETFFCLVVKVECGSIKSLLAFNTTVVKAEEEPKLVNVSLKITGSFNSTYLEQLEDKFDKCVASSFIGSRGESRASLSPLNNKIIVIQRRYFDVAESMMMKNPNIRSCISNISLGLNTSFKIINQVAYTTERPVHTTIRSYYPLTLVDTTPTDSSTTTRFTSQKMTTKSSPKPDVKTESPEKETSILIIIASLFGVFLFAIIVVIVIHVYRRKMAQRRAENASMEMSQIDSTKAPWREIDKGFIATGKELGSGFFGVVLQGTVILDGQSKQCAVKMLKGHATEVNNKELIDELHIISRIGHHPNIINLIGACTRNGPALIVLEFASNGNLLKYLRDNRDEIYTNMTTLRPDTKLDLRTRLKIAYEVAQGMRHLSSKKCVHRDLAARNVLLDEHFVAKVTDFGLSRDVYEEGIYQINTQGKMPLKWMALESLETMTFTTQSDVWSFGVLLWEIETGGATPYPGLMGKEIFQELSSGHRLEQPPTCPDTLYEIMSRCWIRDPSERPSFQQLCNELGFFLEEEAGYEELFISTEPNESSETTTTTNL